MCHLHLSLPFGGWSDGAMVLGKLLVPGRPTILITVGLALAVGAGGVVWNFYSHLSFPLSLPLFWSRPDID